MIYSYVNYVRHLYVLFLLQYLFTIFKKQFVVQLYLSSTFENTDARDTCYHQLSLFVVQKHTKSDNWLCLFILLVIIFVIKNEIMSINFYVNLR